MLSTDFGKSGYWNIAFSTNKRRFADGVIESVRVPLTSPSRTKFPLVLSCSNIFFDNNCKFKLFIVSFKFIFFSLSYLLLLPFNSTGLILYWVSNESK